jgi:murein DD-endopeptidase MepM/ murein hydrolase activator NlpD
MPQRPLRPAPAAVRRSPGRRPAALRRPSRLVTGVIAALAAGAVVLADGGVAMAAPENPTDQQLAEARAAQDVAAAEVGRIAGLVAAAEAQLEQVQVQAEAAGTAYLAAEEAKQAADAAAEQAAQALQVAADAEAAAQARLADFSRDSYKNSSALSSQMALLDADGPADLVRKAATLDYVADHQIDVLGALEAARVQQADADAAARAARDQKAAAEAAAQAAKAEAEAQLANQQTAVTQVSAQKASLDQQLQAAQVQLLSLQGARDAYQAWVAQKAAEEAAARQAAERARVLAAADETSDSSGSGYVRPASGSTSSCYGSRWGVTHFGVDIAAAIGTPVYAATSGTVQRAGAATGFGLAVYIRGDDGAVTVYGHVNEYYVSEGERVSAGEQIAEVGNRGQSTGPHLHFEVHPGGAMYGGQIDPVPWLRARGINIRGCG